MPPIVKKRLYGVLKYHQSQPAAYGKQECVVCLTTYPCITVQIAKGKIEWNFELERFEEKKEFNEKV